MKTLEQATKAPQNIPSSDLADQLTVLRSQDGEMRKSWSRLSHKERWRKTDYDRKATFYDVATVEAGDINALYAALQSSSQDPHTCIIRGRLAPGRPTENIRRNTTQINPGIDAQGGYKGFFDSADRKWVCVDIDAGKLDLPVNPDDAETLELAALRVRDKHLGEKAPELIGVRCVAQWSASAGFESIGHKRDNLAARSWIQTIKLHLWFRLDRSVCNESLRGWLEGMGADAALARTVQPHFVATPRFSDERDQELPDPLAWRLRLLPGDKDVVTSPSELMSTTEWKAKETKRAKNREADQARLRAEAQQIGPTRYSQTWADDALDDPVEQIYSATPGTRHSIVYGQSFRIGRIVGGFNGLNRWAAEGALESAVRIVFAQERDLQNELKAVRDGLDAGAAMPFYLERKPRIQPLAEKVAKDEAPRYQNLTELRGPLAKEVETSLDRPGTTLLVGPTGAGKSTAAARAAAKLSQRTGEEIRVLWAAPTIKTRSEATQKLKMEGVNPWEVVPRNEQNCAALSRYQYANTLMSGGGARYCKDACPHHVKRPNGRCIPPPGLTPPKGTNLMVVSHEMAATIGSKWEPTHVIWDEAADVEASKDETFTHACLHEAAETGEVKGAEALLRLLSASETRDVEVSEVIDAFEELRVGLDIRLREALLDELEDINQLGREVTDWRLLYALQLCCERGGAGARIEAGRLIFDSPPPVPAANTRLIMDATATPLAAQAIYGKHTTKKFELAHNDHTTHLHIKAPCGNRAVGVDGNWDNARLGRLWEALTNQYKDALWCGHKSWLDALPEHLKPHTYYGASDAKGSNDHTDKQAVVLADNFVPKCAKEARVELWALLLQEQGVEADTDLLLEEAVYQMEVAPITQAAGRIRYYEATQENPKTIITIGKERRTGTLGRDVKYITLDTALLTFRGEITARNLGLVAQAFADKNGGIWLEDFMGLLRGEKTLHISDVPTVLFSPINIQGKTELLARHCFEKEKLLKTAHYWWHHQNSSAVRVQPAHRGGSHLHLPPRSGRLASVARRAAGAGWQGWTVYDQQGRQVESVDCITAALYQLPREAVSWSRDQIVASVAERVGASARTVQRRLADQGGLAVLREKLEQQPVELEPATLPSETIGEPPSTATSLPETHLADPTRRRTAPPATQDANPPGPRAIEQSPPAKFLALLRQAETQEWPRVSVFGQSWKGEKAWRGWCERYAESERQLTAATKSLEAR